jgi:2-polyprenyl-3-methyl-5-hydroxy-6-metoxy-1,4-benzoquinol methylase
MAKSLTTESDWSEYQKGYTLVPINKSSLGVVFARYLKPDKSKTCIEIGCNPGKNLVYLSKTYGFKIWGIDFTNIELSRSNLQYHQVPDFNLVEADFQTWQSEALFDIVLSSGFLEHFVDYTDVFNRHARLLAPGGLLFLSVPNLHNGQYIFHWIFDRQIFKTHNLDIMKLEVLQELSERNQLEILELSYFRTIDFWIMDDIKARPIWQQALLNLIFFCARGLNKIIGAIKPIPNRWFSPHLVLVARKPMV